MTCQRNNKLNARQLKTLNDEKQLLEDMKNALNNSNNMNDFENKLKQLRTASLSRPINKNRLNRFAETMTRSNNHHLQLNKTDQFNTKPIIMPSNEHIYESIENGNSLLLNNYLQNDDWSCSTYSTMNDIYDEKPLLLSNRNLHSRQSNYEDQLQILQQNLRDLRQSAQSSFETNATKSASDQLPDLLVKFKNDSFSQN